MSTSYSLSHSQVPSGSYHYRLADTDTEPLSPKELPQWEKLSSECPVDKLEQFAKIYSEVITTQTPSVTLTLIGQLNQILQDSLVRLVCLPSELGNDVNAVCVHLVKLSTSDRCLTKFVTSERKIHKEFLEVKCPLNDSDSWLKTVSTLACEKKPEVHDKATQTEATKIHEDPKKATSKPAPNRSKPPKKVTHYRDNATSRLRAQQSVKHCCPFHDKQFKKNESS
ncbi:hypothetical protein L2734_10480 [Parashewanella spongiae]|nr:hypothetical protein [Parashewanella spongiae]MCL1078581.1 hypothetical protein [Parashewanella spongiae]